MKFCEKHWTQLRAAIDTRGLSHLIHKTGAGAVQASLRELAGTNTKDDYDPLMQANMMIMGAALQLGGLYLMMNDENGNQYCPLCELVKNAPPNQLGLDKNWIEGCTDSILSHCQDIGLVHPQQ